MYYKQENKFGSPDIEFREETTQCVPESDTTWALSILGLSFLLKKK